MFRRMLLAITLLFLPLAALADEADPAATPATQSATGSEVQGGQTGTGSAGGSNADGGSLQPATGSTLGGSGTTDSTGLAAPSSNVLQAPSTDTEQLKVLLGNEADGTPSNAADEQAASNETLVDIAAAVFLMLATGAIVWIRRRQLAAARAHYASMSNR